MDDEASTSLGMSGRALKQSLTAVFGVAIVGVLATVGVEILAPTKVLKSSEFTETFFEEMRATSLVRDASLPAHKTRSGMELNEIERLGSLSCWKRALSNACAIVSTTTGPLRLSSA